MATRSVRFEFIFGRLGTIADPFLIKHHDMPANFIREDATAWLPNIISDRFSETVSPLINLHDSEWNYHAVSTNQKCAVCDGPRRELRPAIFPFVHSAEGPSIKIFMLVLCESLSCASVSSLTDAAGTDPGYEGLAIRPVCHVCNKSEGTRRCRQCKKAVYCGKEHRDQDLKEHEKYCPDLAKDDTVW